MKTRQKIKFRLHKELYSRENIEKAVADFGNVFDVSDEEDYFVLRPLTNEADETVFLELANYLLSLM